MNEIGCFYTDKSVDFDIVDKFTDDELEKIGRMEHMRWLQEHYDMGWSYDEVEKYKRDLIRIHRDMIPDFSGFEISEEVAAKNYERLEKAEQDKDSEPMECLLAMLRVFDGVRLYRL